MKVSVIIVSWNAKYLLEEYLPSVVKTNFRDLEIIIADNASTDGSVEFVNKTFPHIRIYSLDKNFGYCGGNNRAAYVAKGEILVFLNNDAAVDQNWLNPIVNMFISEPETAVIQPKIRSYKNINSFEYAGAAGGWIDSFGFPFCRGRIVDTVENDSGQYNDSANIFWASGAAFCIRKDAFLKSGGFDEDFEFHMEEIDLCWRLQNMGYKIRYCPESIIYHLGGGSLAMNSPRKTFYNFRNNLIMLTKNLPLSRLLHVLFARLFIDTAAILKTLFSGEFRQVIAIKKAWIIFLVNFKNNYNKRMASPDLKSPKLLSGYWHKSIIWAYFVKRKKTFKDLGI